MVTWQGELYNPDLSITEIAAFIRADLQKTFPAYRFSVDSRKKREITISLLEYPVALTNKTLIASYFLMMKDEFMFYDVRRGTFRYKRDITQTETERLIDDLYQHAGLYVRITKYDTWLNPEILNVLLYIQKQMDSYNRKGEAYSDILFHDCINIGTVDAKCRENYAQFVPRTPSGKRVSL